MGLAGARKRQKISHDPNNTTWARDTTGFGHKILAQQGWTPGSFLGAKGAAQSSHFSAASASHIRVALKDDNLGIGAKRVGETAENFGLGALVDIYGRLNGKDEQKMQKEQQARADLGARLYAEQRFGRSRFVRGGFLVGDKIEKDISTSDVEKSRGLKGEPKEGLSLAQSAEPAPRLLEGAEQSADESTEQSAEDHAKESKRFRKEKKRSKKSAEQEESKKRKKKEKTSAEEPESKEERRKRREERRKRKLDKREKRQEASDAASEADGEPSEEAIPSTTPASTTAKMQKTKDSTTTTPTVPAASQFGGSRQAVRRRYIQAKKMAGMDPQALREILMARS